MLGVFQKCCLVGLLVGLLLAVGAGAAPNAVADIPYSIVQTLGEMSHSLTAAVQLSSAATTWKELGKAELERYAAGSSVVVHLPPPPAGGRGVAFTTVLCEEHQHARAVSAPSEGTCFFYTSDSPDTGGAEVEVFLKYEIRLKRREGRRIPQRRGASVPGKGAANKGLSDEDNTSVLSLPSKAEVYIIAESPSNAMDGGDTQRRMLGYAFVEERLDVIGGFGQFSLVFRFSEEVCNAITTSGRTWPVALKLTGVIGDPRERAARQRTAEASTLLHRWVFPVLLLAGLVGMLWLSAQFIEWKYQTTHAAPANSGAEPECSVGAKKRN